MNIKTFCVLCFLMSSISFAAGEDGQLTIADAFDKGISAYKKKNYAGAYQFFSYVMDNATESNKGINKKAMAAFNLSLMHTYGQGVARNPKKKAHFLQISADLGHIQGQHHLGHAYEFGNGVEKDMSTANSWFKKAALNGEASSMYHYGRSLYSGNGISKNKQQAQKWFKIALPLLKEKSKTGDKLVANYFYTMHRYGFGTQENKTLALEGFEYLATRGYAPAQAALGFMYYNGEGTKVDDAQARYWFTKASLSGHKGADKILKKLGWN